MKLVVECNGDAPKSQILGKDEYLWPHAQTVRIFSLKKALKVDSMLPK